MGSREWKSEVTVMYMYVHTVEAGEGREFWDGYMHVRNIVKVKVNVKK